MKYKEKAIAFVEIRTGKGSGRRKFSRGGGSPELVEGRWNRKVPKRSEASREILAVSANFSPNKNHLRSEMIFIWSA